MKVGWDPDENCTELRAAVTLDLSTYFNKVFPVKSEEFARGRGALGTTSPAVVGSDALTVARIKTGGRF